jgi:SAM-dependent methyltransferase
MMTPERRAYLADLEQQYLADERGNTAAGIIAPHPDRWRWSPLDLDEFDRMLYYAVQMAVPAGGWEPGKKMSLFEAGCGIGTKLALASEAYGLFAHGWEIDIRYVHVAESLGVSVEQQDLLKADPHYEDWDIVYIAQPFKDDEVEREWERSVHEAMRPGAVLIAAFASVKPYSWPCAYRAPWRGVWVKPGESAGITVIQREVSPSDG